MISQVYCEERLIGTVDHHDPQSSRVVLHNQHIVADLLDLSGGNEVKLQTRVVDDRVELIRRRRGMRIPQIEFESTRDPKQMVAGYFKRYRVPAHGVTERHDPMIDAKIYEWDVLVIDPKDEETLFDFDQFEPV
jgi:hypothetical protein